MTKSFSWSYSSLTAFELCPAKYHYDRTHKTPSGEAAEYGIAVHKAFEDYVKDQKPLPVGTRVHQKYLDKLIRLGPAPMTEKRIALNRNFQQVAWTDDSAWLRGIIDFMNVDLTADLGILIDMKTGKRRLNWEQVSLQAAMARCANLWLTRLIIGYYWTKLKRSDVRKYQFPDVPNTWQTFIPRAAAMEEGVVNEEYSPKQNFLCRSYCDNRRCKFNGL